ncbi:MAG: hypothetical protein WBB74_03075 [Gaiellaceae bacterium]
MTRLARACVIVALTASVAASAARANGDPASDYLLIDNVFLTASIRPAQTPSGRQLEALAKDAQRKHFAVKIAVIATSSDLGLIPGLYGRPQAYARFLGQELRSFARYPGTLIVTMPAGFGVFGPGATSKARQALKRIPAPRTTAAEQLGHATVGAVRAVATANGRSLRADTGGSGGGSRTTIAIVAGIAAGLLTFGVVGFFGLRRWLLGGERAPQ